MTITLNGHLDPSDKEKGRNATVFNPGSRLIEVPRTEIPGQGEVYPEIVRADRVKFDAAAWELIVRNGLMSFNGTELAEALWKKGIGTKSLDPKAQDRQISLERLREEIGEWAERTRIPIFEFRLAMNREEVRAGVTKRRQHALKMKVAGGGMKKSLDAGGWFDGNKNVALDGRAQEDVALAIKLLSARPYKAGELAVELGRGDRAAYRAWKGKMRQLNHDLRSAGVPICSSPTRGSWIAESPEEAKDYLLHSLLPRVRAEEARTDSLESSGALWYPETDEEKAAAAEWQQSLHSNSPSLTAKRRAEQQRQWRQNSGTNQELNNARRAAQAYVDEHWTSEEFKTVKWNMENGYSVSNEERKFVRNVLSAKRVSKGGKRQRVARGRVPQPWELPHKDDGPSSTGPKVASAAEVLASAGGCSQDEEPIVGPW